MPLSMSPGWVLCETACTCAVCLPLFFSQSTTRQLGARPALGLLQDFWMLASGSVRLLLCQTTAGILDYLQRKRWRSWQKRRRMGELLTARECCCFPIIRPAAVLMAAKLMKPCCNHLWLPRFAVAGPAIAMTAAGSLRPCSGYKTISHLVFWLSCLSLHDIAELLDLQNRDYAAHCGRRCAHHQQQGALPDSC